MESSRREDFQVSSVPYTPSLSPPFPANVFVQMVDGGGEGTSPQTSRGRSSSAPLHSSRERSSPEQRRFSPMRNMVTSLFGGEDWGSRRRRSPDGDAASHTATTLSGAFYLSKHGSGDEMPLHRQRSAVSPADIMTECRGLCSVMKTVLESDIYRDMPTARVDLSTRSSIGLTLKDCTVESCLVGSPAYTSRMIDAGDVITHIDGIPVTAHTVRAELIGEDMPGTMVCLDVRKRSGELVQVLIQRASTLVLAEKRKMSDLLKSLRQSALQARDNTTMRLVDDLVLSWDSVTLSEADQAAAVRRSWDTTRMEAAQILASLEILLAKFDVGTMGPAQHELAQERAEALVQLNRSEDEERAIYRERELDMERKMRQDAQEEIRAVQEALEEERQRVRNLLRDSDNYVVDAVYHPEEREAVFEAREQELEGELRTLRASLASAQQALAISQSQEAEMQLELKQILQKQRMQQATEQAEYGRQAWQHQREQMEEEIAALRASLAASHAIDSENRATISDLLASTHSKVLPAIGAQEELARSQNAAQKEMITQKQTIQDLKAQLAKLEEQVRDATVERDRKAQEVESKEQLIVNLTFKLETLRNQTERSRTEEGREQDLLESELMVSRFRCQTLETALEECEKRRKQVEVQAMEEAESMATLVEDLRHKMEEQLKDLRAEHERVEFERDNAVAELKLAAKLERDSREPDVARAHGEAQVSSLTVQELERGFYLIEEERHTLQPERESAEQMKKAMEVETVNGPGAERVVDDVLECYDCMDKDAMIRSQEAAINELKLALVRADSANERGVQDLRPCNDCMDKEENIRKQQADIDRLTAVIRRAERSDVNAAEREPGQNDSVDIKIKLGMEFSSAGEEGTNKRKLFQQTLLLDIVDAAAIPPSRLSIKGLAPGSIVVSARIGPDPFGRGPSASQIANDLTQQAADSTSKLRSGKFTRHTQQLVVSSSTLPFQIMVPNVDRDESATKRLKESQDKVQKLEEQRDHLLMDLDILALQVDGLKKKLELADADKLAAQQVALDAKEQGLRQQHEVQPDIDQRTIAQLHEENKELHATIAELKRNQGVGRDSDDDEHLQGMAMKLVRLSRERDEMKTARDRVQGEFNAATRNYEALIADLKDQVEAMADKVRSSSLHTDELRRKMASAQEKCDNAKRQRDAMETKLQTVEEERDTALGDLQDLKTRMSNLQEVEAAKTNKAKLTLAQDREAWHAERKMMQSTMELAEERFVEEKNKLMRAHEEQNDRWQIELSTEKQLLDQKLKSMQASYEQDRALFRAQMEEEGQYLRSELADVKAKLEKERNAARTAHTLSKEAMLKTETQVQRLEDNLSALAAELAFAEKSAMSLSTALEDSKSKLQAAIKMQRGEKEKFEAQIISLHQDIEFARAEALTQSLSVRVLAEEKAERERDVSRLDIKLFASKQEIEDLREKLELASMNQSLVEKERDSLIKERQRKMELAEKEKTTELSDLQRICKDLTLEKAEQSKQISMLTEQLDRKNQLLQDSAQGEIEMVQLRSQVAHLLSEKEVSAKELQELRESVGRIACENKDLGAQNDMASLQAEKESLEKMIALSQSSLQEMQQKLTEANALLSQERSERILLQEKVSFLQEKNSELARALETELPALQARMNEQQQQAVQREQQRVSTLEEANHALVTDLQAEQERLREQQEATAELQKEHNKLIKDFSVLQKQQEQPEIDEKLGRLKLSQSEREIVTVRGQEEREKAAIREDLLNCQRDLTDCRQKLRDYELKSTGPPQEGERPSGIDYGKELLEQKMRTLVREHEQEIKRLNDSTTRILQEREEAIGEIKELNAEAEAREAKVKSMKGRILQLVRERDEARQVAESLHAKFSELLVANPDMVMPSAYEPTGEDNEAVRRMKQDSTTAFDGDDLEHRMFHGSSPPASNANPAPSPPLSGVSRLSQGSHVDGRPVSWPNRVQRPTVPPDDENNDDDSSDTYSVTYSDT